MRMGKGRADAMRFIFGGEHVSSRRSLTVVSFHLQGWELNSTLPKDPKQPYIRGSQGGGSKSGGLEYLRPPVVNRGTRLCGSTLWGSTFWGSRESQATNFGSGEPDSGGLHSGGLENLGPPLLDVGTRLWTF